MHDNFPLTVGDVYIISHNGPMQLTAISETDMLLFKHPGDNAEPLYTSNVAILRPVMDRDWGIWNRYYTDAQNSAAIADLAQWKRQGADPKTNEN